MRRDDPTYAKMYAELENYEKNGVCIMMDGYNASPQQVVRAHMTRENVSYMRDYEMDAEGRLTTLSFTNINKNRRKRRYVRPHNPLYAGRQRHKSESVLS